MPTIPIANAALPLEGLLSFGFQRSATHRHNGIDLPAPAGTLVLAAHSGLVKYATTEWQQGFTGYGNVVVLANEDGTFSLYAHLDVPLVQPGEPVHEGEPIGRVGTTQYNAPDHTSRLPISGAHLHFETSATPYPQASEAPRLDPVAWLKEGARIAAAPFDHRRIALDLDSRLSSASEPSRSRSHGEGGKHES